MVFVRIEVVLTKIFILGILAEKAREYSTSLYLAFVEWREAYDCVSDKAHWKVLDKEYMYHLP